MQEEPGCTEQAALLEEELPLELLLALELALLDALLPAELTATLLEEALLEPLATLLEESPDALVAPPPMQASSTQSGVGSLQQRPSSPHASASGGQPVLELPPDDALLELELLLWLLEDSPIDLLDELPWEGDSQ